MKILIIGPSWVGDMVMSQGLYIELKHRYPHAIIDVLAPSWCGPILNRMPEINQAIDMPIGHKSLNIKKRWKIGRRLSKKNYTHAFVLPNSAKSALIPLFAGITQRSGWKGEYRYGLLNDLRPNKRIFQYMVERYVALASTKNNMRNEVSLDHCPKPRLVTFPEQQTKLRSQFSLYSSREIIGLCPGAEFGPAKRWPDKYYAEVASYLIEHGKQVWLFGSVKDQDVTNLIQQSLPLDQQHYCFNLAGKTSLIDVVDLLACCHTVISNDSGLMHIAAAVGCKIVAIYGSTSPKYTPPLSEDVIIVNSDIECRPCFKRECPYGHLNCLMQLTPDKIITRINKHSKKTKD